ncbi:leucine-rich repeat protein [Acetobacterium sp.]|uniref:leucine-rich repeat protein n=1 Tax=Acetobacterium sp. TaxID=1872094 RepID=UPI0035948FE8
MKGFLKAVCLFVSVMLLVVIPSSVLAGNSQASGEGELSNNEAISSDEVLGAEVAVNSEPFLFGDYVLQYITGGVLITNYLGHGGDINVGDSWPGMGVVNIGHHAFQYYTALTGVKLSRTVTVEEEAFIGCNNLDSVTMSDEMRTIEERAFSGCSSLKSIRIPAKVTTMGEDIFLGCSDLTIYGERGSTAETYANTYGITFIPDYVAQTVSCEYRTHVQNYGWQTVVADGATSGTSGQGLRLEAIQIALKNEGLDLGVAYRTHVQNYGWQEWVYDMDPSGSSGQGLRLEAIDIYLTGSDAVNYDIYYRVHAQNFGWLDWAKNARSAGTSGYGYRLEAIQIKIVPKGSAAPGPTAIPYLYPDLARG